MTAEADDDLLWGTVFLTTDARKDTEKCSGEGSFNHESYEFHEWDRETEDRCCLVVIVTDCFVLDSSCFLSYS